MEIRWTWLTSEFLTRLTPEVGLHWHIAVGGYAMYRQYNVILSLASCFSLDYFELKTKTFSILLDNLHKWNILDTPILVWVKPFRDLNSTLLQILAMFRLPN